MVRFEGITGRHSLAVGLSLALGLTACANDQDAATPKPTATSSVSPAAPISAGPASSDWLADLEADGTALYVTSHSCPGQVTAGLCTINEAFPPRLKAFPVTLWRYADGTWEHLGEPGVFSYSDMMALPGGLMLVPRTGDASTGGATTGPLRVSLDHGRTWDDWQIPQQPRRCRSDFSGPGSGPCTVAVAGSYVVIASPFGWIRRSTGSADWEEITPPKRAPMSDFDSLGYGLLVLDDGTLVATANASLEPGGFYRVSKDVGSTWSAPHANPGEISELDHVDGSTVYAMCWKVDVRSSKGTSGSQCPWYRSTDLEHWSQTASVAEGGTCTRRAESSTWRETEISVRAGALVYAITYVPYVNGHEGTHKNMRHADMPHRAAHVLERSADGCTTWTEVLHAQ